MCVGPLHHYVVPLPRFAGEDKRCRLHALDPHPFTGEGAQTDAMAVESVKST
jgi:hypothetical protein